MMKIPDNDEDTCIGKCEVAAWKRWKKRIFVIPSWKHIIMHNNKNEDTCGRYGLNQKLLEK